MSIKQRNKVDVTFNMSSMTDIVFLLLIFFIILSTMISPVAEKVKLPISSAKTTGKQHLSITINEQLNYFVNGNAIEKNFVETFVREKMSLEKDKQLGIVLHTDEATPLEEVLFVMELANRNKYELILATKPEKRN